MLDFYKYYLRLGSVDYAECGVLKMPSVENVWKMSSLEKCGRKTRSVENEEWGKCGVSKTKSVENAERGKRGVWKMSSVEKFAPSAILYSQNGYENFPLQ